jgi:hypothetical protein
VIDQSGDQQRRLHGYLCPHYILTADLAPSPAREPTARWAQGSPSEQRLNLR